MDMQRGSEKNAHHLPGIGKQTHREKQLAAMNKRHQEREYKMPSTKRRSQQKAAMLVHNPNYQLGEVRSQTEQPDEANNSEMMH